MDLQWAGEAGAWGIIKLNRKKKIFDELRIELEKKMREIRLLTSNESMVNSSDARTDY